MFNPLRGWSLSLFLYPQFYWGLCTVNPLGVKKELPQAPKGDVKKICITQINLGVMHIILLRSYSADPNYYSIVIKLVFTAQIMSSAVLRTLVFKKILVR